MNPAAITAAITDMGGLALLGASNRDVDRHWAAGNDAGEGEEVGPEGAGLIAAIEAEEGRVIGWTRHGVAIAAIKGRIFGVGDANGGAWGVDITDKLIEEAPAQGITRLAALEDQRRRVARGAVLKEFRTAAKMRQWEVAKAMGLGISQTQYSRLEMGARALFFRELSTVARALKTTPLELAARLLEVEEL